MVRILFYISTMQKVLEETNIRDVSLLNSVQTQMNSAISFNYWDSSASPVFVFMMNPTLQLLEINQIKLYFVIRL